LPLQQNKLNVFVHGKFLKYDLILSINVIDSAGWLLGLLLNVRLDLGLYY